LLLLTKLKDLIKNIIGYKITPLYNIDIGYYRDIKLAEIFKDSIPETNPKFYRLNKNYIVNSNYAAHGGSGYEYESGRIFVDIDGYHCWCLATPKSPRIGSHLSHLIRELKSKNMLDEINIEEEYWIHPHISREVEEIIKLKNKNKQL